MNDQITCTNISAGYGGPLVIRDINLEIPNGKITALIGPNGCGKSTLLKVIGRQLEAASGVVELGGRPADSMKAREFARRLAFLPQQPTVPEGMAARELIAFGRYPYTGAFASLTADDYRVIEEAAAATRVGDYLDRPAAQLSGGQRQRMWIAMTLAQQSSIMLLDEPTTFLDPAHQLAILDLLKELNREGRTLVMVVHDMVHAAKYSDQVVVMKDGRILAAGPTEQTLDCDLIARAFGISAMMVADPETGRKLPIAYGVRR
ncbi:Probable siderophore transport system ATP-binding protein YusV [Trueperella pyogenes]|uniref:ABC transporter ATP-binding protein n=1 Tax=Trueperella pyogenes TaxID=1661 RepID=UPI000E03E45E|nr:ABC transporter ATP-binding protein [Trueperella pyogenes]MBB3025803.1 iron complex transport system ATP-binding protein [Trueperella pyogenes]SUO86557.1 Probable siderophore transport system ATP-binding protein YusV [Trueperella pyogenes]